MSMRRSRRTAAAAAETRIAKVVEEDSEDSAASNYDEDGGKSSGSDDDSVSSGNASDADFDVASVQKSRSVPKGRKTGPTAQQPVEQRPIANPASALSASSTPTSVSSSATSESYKELEDSALKSLMRSFRLTDLQALMISMGKNKAGRKTELMDRAYDLVDKSTGDIKKRLSEKIQELSNAMYKSMSSAPSVNPYSSTYRPTANAGAYNPNESNGYVNGSQAPVGQAQPPQAAAAPPAVQTPRYESSFQAQSSYYRDTSHLMYPTFPDVKLRNLPFYKIEGVLLKPSALQPRGMARFQEQTFSFHLTPTQANEIMHESYRDTYGRQEYKKQIQLRFSLLETSCEQDDNFPSSVCVKVNGRLQTLPNPIPTNKPGVEPKRPPKPINITALCKLSSTVPNYINVTWAVEVGSGYTVSVYFVDKLSSKDLMDELKKKGKRHSDFTRAVIKDKLSDKEDEIATTSCKVTLACPLGKMRMTVPCRASTCDHLQCFDANLFLMMNEKKPKWSCPVCNKPALYENLLIDGYFTDVLTSKRLPLDEHEIVLNSDASWDPLVPAKKEDQKPPSPAMDMMKKSAKVETLSLDDDDDDDYSRPMPAAKLIAASAAKVPPPASKEVDYVTLDSDDDDDVIRPPSGKRARIADDDDSSGSAVVNIPSVPGTPPSAPTATIPPLPGNIGNGGNHSPEIICLDDD